MQSSTPVNYHGHPYREVKTYMKVKSTVRTYIKSGGYHLIFVPSIYKLSLINFVDKYYPIERRNKIQAFNIDVVFSDRTRNNEKFMDSSIILLHSNSFLKREDLKQFFSQTIKNIYGETNICFEQYVPVVQEQSDGVYSGSLIGSFDDAPELSVPSKEVLLPTNDLTEQDLLHIFPVFPTQINMSYFYAGFRVWCSLSSEIVEASDRGMN